MRVPLTGPGYGATRQRKDLGQEERAGCPASAHENGPVVRPRTDEVAKAAILIDTSLLDSNLHVAEKMLLIHLFRFAGRDRRAWPSEKTLAAKVRLSPRTVRQHLKAIEHKGLIVCRRRRGSSKLFILPAATTLDEHGNLIAEWDPLQAKGSECEPISELSGRAQDCGDGADLPGSPAGPPHGAMPGQDQGREDATGGEVFSAVESEEREAHSGLSCGRKVFAVPETERIRPEFGSPGATTDQWGDPSPGGAEVSSPELDDVFCKYKSSSRNDLTTKIARDEGREFPCSASGSGPWPAACLPNGFHANPGYAKAVIEGWERTFGVELGRPFGIHLIGADYMLWLKERGHEKEIRNPNGYLWAVVTNGDVIKTNWLTWPEREAKKEEQRKLEEKRKKEREKEHELRRREMARRKEWEDLGDEGRAPYCQMAKADPRSTIVSLQIVAYLIWAERKRGKCRFLEDTCEKRGCRPPAFDRS